MHQARVGYLFSGTPWTDAAVQQALSQTLGGLPADVEVVDGLRVVAIQVPAGMPVAAVELALGQKLKEDEACTRCFCVVADAAVPRGLIVGC